VGIFSLYTPEHGLTRLDKVEGQEGRVKEDKEKMESNNSENFISD